MFDDPDSRIRLDNSESGTLIIANANLEDSGKYICRAENKYSKNPIIESAVIDVRRRSKAVSPEYQKAVIKVRKSKTHFLNVYSSGILRRTQKISPIFHFLFDIT